MCRKLIYVMAFALMLGSTAQAAVYLWNGSAGDGNWDTALNWTVTDSVWTWPNEEFGNKMVNDDTLGIDILNGEAVSRGSQLAIQGAADGSTTGVLTLNNASSLAVTGRLAIGGGDNTLGQIDILGGSYLAILGDGNDFKVVDNDGTWGTLNIVDSTVDIIDDLAIDQGEGYVNISGSSTLNADAIIIADANTAVGYLDISGTATVNLVDDFKIDEGIGTITIGGDAVINFGDDCYIPDKTGEGTMTLTDNSVFNVGDDMTIADDATTVGHVIVSGNATLNAPDELYLADANTAFATLDIIGNATVNVGDDLDIASDGPAICNIGENATVTVADKIYVGENNEFAPFEGQMTISGNATVEVTGAFVVVDNAGNTGYLHISGNPTIHTANNFYMNDDGSDDPNDPMPSTSQVIMDGGTVTVDGYTTFNDDNPGMAEFIMNGGSFYSADYLNLSDNLDGTAHLTMNGGEMITGDRLRLGKDGGEDIGQVRIFMNGGLLQAEDLDIEITDTKIICTGGEIRIRQPFQPDPVVDPNTWWGLSEADMQDLIDNGTIVVEGAYSIVVDGDYTLVTIDTSLVAYYLMDEGSGNTTADASGNGHDGVILGTPTWIDSMSGYGTALYFAGFNPADGYVDCGTWNPSEETGQLTVALWARYDGPVEGVWQRVIGKRDGWAEDSMMWQIEINRDNQQIALEGIHSYPVGGGAVLPEGQWAHVAFTFDGTTAIFYVNGEETDRGDFSFGTKTDSALTIGADNPEGWNSFHGALDEVILYNRALSDAEVLELASK